MDLDQSFDFVISIGCVNQCGQAHGMMWNCKSIIFGEFVPEIFGSLMTADTQRLTRHVNCISEVNVPVSICIVRPFKTKNGYKSPWFIVLINRIDGIFPEGFFARSYQ